MGEQSHSHPSAEPELSAFKPTIMDYYPPPLQPAVQEAPATPTSPKPQSVEPSFTQQAPPTPQTFPGTSTMVSFPTLLPPWPTSPDSIAPPPTPLPPQALPGPQVPPIFSHIRQVSVLYQAPEQLLCLPPFPPAPPPSPVYLSPIWEPPPPLPDSSL